MAADSEARPELAELRLGDLPEAWAALGFSIDGSSLQLGGVRLSLGAPGRGIVAWTLRGIRAASSIDGLVTEAAGDPPAPRPVLHGNGAVGVHGDDAVGVHGDDTVGVHGDDTVGVHGDDTVGVHGNGAVGVDHVVVVTPDFDRTVAALGEHAMAPRRIRHVGEGPGAFRQAFRRLGPAILEVVESARVPPGPARFWGLTLIVSDLDAFVAELGPERISAARDAVQPGRRIATLRREAGLGQPVAVMDPDPA